MPSVDIARASPSPVSNSEEKESTIEEKVTAFYQKYNPGKLANVPKVLEKYAGREDELLTRLHAQYKVPMLESAIKEKAAQIDNKTKLTMQYAEAAAAGASAKDPSSFLGPNVNHPAIQSLIEHFRREKQGYNIASVVAPLIEAVVKASPDAADKINGALSLYGVKKAGTTMTSASAAPASPTRSRSGSVVNGGPTAFTSSSSSFTAPAPVGGPGDGGGSGKSPSISAPSLFGGQTASTSINKPAGASSLFGGKQSGPQGASSLFGGGGASGSTTGGSGNTTPTSLFGKPTITSGSGALDSASGGTTSPFALSTKGVPVGPGGGINISKPGVDPYAAPSSSMSGGGTISPFGSSNTGATFGSGAVKPLGGASSLFGGGGSTNTANALSSSGAGSGASSSLFGNKGVTSAPSAGVSARIH